MLENVIFKANFYKILDVKVLFNLIFPLFLTLAQFTFRINRKLRREVETETGITPTPAVERIEMLNLPRGRRTHRSISVITGNLRVVELIGKIYLGL